MRSTTYLYERKSIVYVYYDVCILVYGVNVGVGLLYSMCVLRFGGFVRLLARCRRAVEELVRLGGRESAWAPDVLCRHAKALLLIVKKQVVR